MIITKETDYAIRIMRKLSDGGKHTLVDISENEMIPKQFAYQILRKLTAAGYVAVSRGRSGGCMLRCSLADISLYDIMRALGENWSISACTDAGYDCKWRDKEGVCTVHCQLAAIEQRLFEELGSISVYQLITGKGQ